MDRRVSALHRVRLSSTRQKTRSEFQKRDRFCFFSWRRRHTRYIGDWSSVVCSSDLRRPHAICWKWLGRNTWSSAPTHRSTWVKSIRWNISAPCRALQLKSWKTFLIAPPPGYSARRSEERRVGKGGGSGVV